MPRNRDTLLHKEICKGNKEAGIYQKRMTDELANDCNEIFLIILYLQFDDTYTEVNRIRQMEEIISRVA